ncbi:hypothetical protein ETD86_46820 [Nonomuraea turkmeniaca]|uniref:Heme A synthase n=1 Tax=Nonomuraea turkmeniaca TaxID=103838 RepID=A0A5S4EYD6_9ACTN|nr:hypothetical protein [Nonomuraea turkmeniaca]TMR08652.1 hypothetical protein ETD86_46820 [Nonomuraea turkmeniaca]
MRNVYKVLAYLVAIEVAVQAAVMVWGDAGMGKWIDEGGVLDKTLGESGEMPFPEFMGLIIHAFNGMIAIPVIALLLLISSFWAKVPGAGKAAGLVLLLVALQVTFGILGHNIPLVGAVHGLNALLLFTAALYAARRGAAVRVQEPQFAARG